MNDASDPIALMRLGTEYRAQVSVRGFKVHLRPLTISESVQVAQEVVEDFQRAPETARNALLEATLLAKHTLYRASTSGPEATDYKLHTATLDRFTPDELIHMHRQYLDVVERANPSLEKLTDQELGELVELVKKNPEELTGLSRSRLLAVARHLVS